MSDNDADNQEYSDDRPWQDEAVLRRLFLDEGLNGAEIAERLGCTRGTSNKWLRKFGLDNTEPWHDEETLRRLYDEEGLSLGAIAEKFDVTRQAIRYWTEKYGLSPDRPWRNEETLRRLYVDEELTSYEVADEFDCKQHTVLTWLHKFDIPIYTQTPDGLEDRELLVELYKDKGLTLSEVADKLDTDPQTVWRWMKHHEIPRRSGDFKPAEEHRFWDGGRYVGYYGPNWPEQRRKAMERDGSECRVCGMSNKQHLELNGCELHVHHLESKEEYRDEAGTLDYEAANRLENLLSLCSSHHRKYEVLPIRPQVV